MTDDRDKKLIQSLSERLYICSRLLTAAAERLGWDDETVQALMQQLQESIERDMKDVRI